MFKSLKDEVKHYLAFYFGERRIVEKSTSFNSLFWRALDIYEKLFSLSILFWVPV